MQEKLISADNHIDMTYCPPDLWSDAGAAEVAATWRRGPRNATTACTGSSMARTRACGMVWGRAS